MLYKTPLLEQTFARAVSVTQHKICSPVAIGEERKFFFPPEFAEIFFHQQLKGPGFQAKHWNSKVISTKRKKAGLRSSKLTDERKRT